MAVVPLLALGVTMLVAAPAYCQLLYVFAFERAFPLLDVFMRFGYSICGKGKSS